MLMIVMKHMTDDVVIRHVVEQQAFRKLCLLPLF